MGGISRIIFLTRGPFSVRDYTRFGIELLEKNGFAVEVWDFTPFLYPAVFRKVKVPDPISYHGYRLFRTRAEALAALAQLEPASCFLVSLLEYQANSILLYRAMTRHGLEYALFRANALPQLNGSATLASRIKARLKGLTARTLIERLCSRIPPAYLGISPATMTLAGGEKSYPGSRLVGAQTEILWLHTLDYDIYLQEIARLSAGTSGYGVFLDAYLPFHPDYLFSGVQPLVTPEHYYPALCRYFDALEKELGIKMVIAAHPRAHYDSHPDYFFGRPVLSGKTVELVRAASFVVLHFSTALNFAVLFKKPMLFITTDELKESAQGGDVDAMAAVFGKQAINISAPPIIARERDLVVDEEAYSTYKNSYIKKAGSEDLPFWQIFANRIGAHPGRRTQG